MNKKSKQQEKLYNFIIAKSFQQPVGSTFTYGELRKKYNVVCSTNDQRESRTSFCLLD
ncbi:hypothetical protein UM715_05985 [Staphylococcus aureus]|nr:hypothetical protein UM715_05985 [Staphylococcus aureus]